MDKKKKEKNFDNEMQSADNLAYTATKEQNIYPEDADSCNENLKDADNVSEEFEKLNDS